LQEHHDDGSGMVPWNNVVIHQSDPAAIVYSSGTTGRAKAVELTLCNLICSFAVLGPGSGCGWGAVAHRAHLPRAYGFIFCLRAVLAAQTLVLHTTKRLNATRDLLSKVGRYRVTRLALAPPTLLAIVQAAEETVNCGGASISPENVRRFNLKFPHVCLLQVGFTAASPNWFLLLQ
jgi:4-coumarate--CoA ligase